MEEELETARNQPDTVEQEIEELKQQISSQALHRATLIHEYKVFAFGSMLKIFD